MDAYDHVAQATIRSSALPLDTPIASGTTTPNPAASSTSAASQTSGPTPSANSTEPGTLSSDLQDAYNSFSASGWGATIGGLWGTVRKSGESVISGVRNEASIASEEALKGFGELRKEIVGIGSGARNRGMSSAGGEDAEESSQGTKKKDEMDGEGSTKASGDARETPSAAESDGFVARFRAEAEKRLKDIQKAEDAADEALLRFGSNIRNFLRDAVTVSAPETSDNPEDQTGQLLFESKDAEGKRVIHTTRFDAQLHVIHCSLDSFLKDPASAEYSTWKKDFSVEKHTEDIASSLQKYEDLRRAMEKLVPERVDYNTFWTRYYFLRMVIESEEKRRKEMLKGAALKREEEVGWDEDSDDEQPATPQPKAKSKSKDQTGPEITVEPAEPRKSGDQHSQPDSDASYDLVSGATSRTPSSPKDDKDKDGEKKTAVATKAVKDESDEEDWE